MALENGEKSIFRKNTGCSYWAERNRWKCCRRVYNKREVYMGKYVNTIVLNKDAAQA